VIVSGVDKASYRLRLFAESAVLSFAETIGMLKYFPYNCLKGYERPGAVGKFWFAGRLGS